MKDEEREETPAATYFTCSLTKNPYLFQGQRLDPETGLYYFKNRYYDPVHGRFITRDPAGMVDGPNLYAFVNNNPINFVDPYGYELFTPQAKLSAKICAAQFKLLMYKSAQTANKRRVEYLIKKLEEVKPWMEQYTNAPHNGYKGAKTFYESNEATMKNATAKIQELQEKIKTTEDEANKDAAELQEKMNKNPDLQVSKPPAAIIQEAEDAIVRMKKDIESQEHRIQKANEDLRDMPVPPVDPATKKYDFDEVKFTAVLIDWQARVSKEMDDRIAADTVLQKAVDDAQAELDALRKAYGETTKKPSNATN